MEDIDWPLLLLCLLGSVAGGLLIFHTTAGFYHLRYYRRHRDDGDAWKCQPKRWLRDEQQREAALLSTANLSLGGLCSGALIYAIVQGLPTRLYFEVSDYGWAYTLGSVVVYFVLIDAAAYYVHRGLHFKPIFLRVHRHHHRYIATSPYVTIAMHPIELLSLQFVSMAPMFFMPLHPAVIGVVLVYVLVFNIIDHSGVNLDSSLPWQASTRYHDDHHLHFHTNFGQHLMLWDRMHGTLRRQKRQYGVEVFGGKGEATEASGAALPDFVKY